MDSAQPTPFPNEPQPTFIPAAPWVWTGSLLCGDILSIVAFVSFPLLTFYGRRFFPLILSTSSMIAAGYFAFLLIGFYAHLNPMMEGILVAVAGVAALIASMAAPDIGVFSLGAIAGALLSNLALHFMRLPLGYLVDELWFRLLFVSIPAVLIGILAVSALSYSIRAISAFVGSYLLVASLSRFLWRVGASNSAPLDPPTFFGPLDLTSQTPSQVFTVSLALTYSLLALWGVLTIIGLVAQYHSTYEYKSIDRIHVNGSEYRRVRINENPDDPQRIIAAHSSYQQS